jgi:hypothetical protein
MLRPLNRLNPSSPSLAALGIRERSAAKAYDALVSSGWTQIGYGYHGTVHAHPGHPDLVVRLARKADGFGDYAALLLRGFSGSQGPHAPRVHDLHVSPCGALLTVSARLDYPDHGTWWLPFAHAVLADHPSVRADPGVRERFKAQWPAHEPFVDHPSFDGLRERFRAAWPGYEPFVEALRAVAPQGLDPNIGNVLMGRDGSPVVNDPLCDDGHGLWRAPASLWAKVRAALLGRLTAVHRGGAPAAA